MLGPLEARVIAAVRTLGRANAREVMNELRKEGPDVAYTTVTTILNRLFRKGLVLRETESFKGARRYVYSYKNFEREYIDWLLEGLTNAFGQRGVVHLAERLDELSEEQVRELARRLKP